jgi:hypothetical protein
MLGHLDIRSKSDCYKEFKIGSQLHKRYSKRALEVVMEALKKEMRMKFGRSATTKPSRL